MYSVYVVELDPIVRGRRACVNALPNRPAVYVGQTVRVPEERLAEHLAGTHAARIVRDHAMQLLPNLSANYGPYPTRAEAEAAEARLAAKLKRRGYCVFGGH